MLYMLTFFLAVALQTGQTHWELPTNGWQSAPTVDRIMDTEQGNVCYIVRMPNEHGISISCLPLKK